MNTVHSLQTAQAQNNTGIVANVIYTDDDLDEQIAQAAAAQSEYDEWKSQLAADCHKTGVSFPTGYALQRAWNSEQKKRGEQRKTQAMRERRKQAIIRQMQLLREELLAIDKDAVVPVVPAAEEELDFDAITSDLLRVQEQRMLMDKAAHREQEQLFNPGEI